MTTTAWRVERGRETQRVLAEYWQAHGWPYAQPVGAGRPGADVTGMPGLAPECKAVRGWQPQKWLRQADGRAGVAFVVARLDGQGPRSVKEWAAVARVDEFTRLLHLAGFGDCPIEEDFSDE